MRVLAVAAALVLLLSAGQASAQSEVTGTLSSGTAATGSTATGTITGGSSNTISGTVVEDEDDNDGGGGGGGGSRRSNSNNNNDDGDVLGTETGPVYGVGGGGDFPGVPNTGTGPDASAFMTLLASLIAMLGGGYTLRSKAI